MKNLKSFFNYIVDKNVARHSQALSFATILSLVPIITIFIGFIASSSVFFNINDEINVFFNSYLFPKTISKTFNEYFNIFSQQASNMKWIGILFFLLSIFLLFSDMQNSFSDLLGDSKFVNFKSKVQKKATKLFILFFAPIICFILVSVFNWLTSLNILFLGEMINTIIHYNFIIKIIIFVVLWAWFSFLFYLMPNKKLETKSIFIGASIATVLFILSQKIFGYYISTYANYELIYGVFSIVPIFFIWIYLNWQITLYSLLIANFMEENAKMEKSVDLAS